jgi:zinc transport system permease protein
LKSKASLFCTLQKAVPCEQSPVNGIETLAQWPLIGPLLQVESNGVSFAEALPILQNGLIACLLCAAIAGILGVHVILRRIVFVSAALSQMASLGIAIALAVLTLSGAINAFEVQGVPSVFSLAGSVGLVSTLLAGAFFAHQSREQQLTRESILGLAYIVPTMLTFIILHGLSQDTHLIDKLLYGNAVMVETEHLWPLALLLIILVILHTLFFKAFVACAFDKEVAAASGLPVRFLDQLFYALLATSIAFSIHAIGALSVFGFLVVPAAAGLLFSQNYTYAVISTLGISVFSALAGFYASFVFDLPTGPAILMVSALFLIPAWIKQFIQGR